ncbi:hypothetical protein [Prosthecobacter sp.]|uniref:hypothetical protein n=1 Tax=Prosthecobacter sp. TaxID=1965333 RepID=UPI003782D745
MIKPIHDSMATAAPSAKYLPLVLLIPLLCFGRASADDDQPEEKAEEHTLPLPRWSAQELKRFRASIPDGNSPGVLPPKSGESASDINELINTPLPSSPRLDHFFNTGDSELSPRLQTEDMRLFLPEAILGLPTQGPASTVQLPTPIASLKAVSQEFLAACAQSLPKEYFIDPEQIAPEIQNHDMMRLLGFHAQDARIKLYVLVIGHDQKLPEGAELEKFASGSLLQSEACLVVYPLGEPWRTRLFVSRSIHNQISTEFLSETIQACLNESLQTSNVHDQLRRYTIHLSTRLFWLQKALAPDPADKTPKDQALAEFSSELKNPSPSPSTQSRHPLLLWMSGSLLLLGIIGIGCRQFLHRLQLRRQRCVWMLAEPETPPRLGGAFTGGGGGMIRYV